jgi:tetratricopeptide (TPR) repeat protein
VTAVSARLSESYEGLLLQAQAASHAGHLDEAAALYRRLVDRLSRLGDRIRERRPDLRQLEEQARGQFYDLLYFEGQYAEAIEVVAPLVASHPQTADVWRSAIAVARVAREKWTPDWPSCANWPKPSRKTPAAGGCWAPRRAWKGNWS